MEHSKKILLALPDSLVEEIDRSAKESHCSRSAFIRTALKAYMTEEKRRILTEQMKAGYREMGALNLTLTEEALGVDTEQEISYEEFLSRCD